MSDYIPQVWLFNVDATKIEQTVSKKTVDV
jgi:hypothetical protein